MSDAVNRRSNGRAPGGQFGPGNDFARGNPNNRRMAELRRAILSTETPDRVAAVVAKLREMALEGDATAARIYLEHTVGRPAQAIELVAEARPLVDREAQLAMLADEEAMDLACRLDERIAWVGRNGYHGPNRGPDNRTITAR